RAGRPAAGGALFRRIPARPLRRRLSAGAVILHIALFMSDLGGGGTQRRFLALAQAFAAAGHRVDLVVASAAGDFRDRVPATARLVALDATASPWLRRRRGLLVAASA